MQSFFKKYFVSGALVLVPIIITIWILRGLILWCEDFFTAIIPVSLRPINLFGFEIPGLGLLFTLLLIFLTGIVTRLYIGAKLLHAWDRIINRIPFGRTLYHAIKQFMDTVVASKQQSFRQVVMVEFPTKGNFMIGFITQESSQILKEQTGPNAVNVFVPTSPNPTSGFLIVALRDNIKQINMTPEQAFKLILSGGAIG